MFNDDMREFEQRVIGDVSFDKFLDKLRAVGDAAGGIEDKETICQVIDLLIFYRTHRYSAVIRLVPSKEQQVAGRKVNVHEFNNQQLMVFKIPESDFDRTFNGDGGDFLREMTEFAAAQKADLICIPEGTVIEMHELEPKDLIKFEPAELKVSLGQLLAIRGKSQLSDEEIMKSLLDAVQDVVREVFQRRPKEQKVGE